MDGGVVGDAEVLELDLVRCCLELELVLARQHLTLELEALVVREDVGLAVDSDAQVEHVHVLEQVQRESHVETLHEDLNSAHTHKHTTPTGQHNTAHILSQAGREGRQTDRGVGTHMSPSPAGLKRIGWAASLHSAGGVCQRQSRSGGAVRRAGGQTGGRVWTLTY